MNNTAINAKDYIGYEYREITVDRNSEALYLDSYENFGWQFDGRALSLFGITKGMVQLKFKRNRKLLNKMELTRLQRQFDSCTSEIKRLEQSKLSQAYIVSFTIGVIGTAFMASSVFAYLGGMVLLCIVLAIPAFIGWIIPYFAYNSTYRKKVSEVTPIIDSKYDEIYEVCKKANSLI